jgi:serine/threonine-protein kinase
MHVRKRVLGLLAGCIAVHVAGSAGAQTSSSDKVTAEALFEDARRLMGDGKYGEACPKFAASERLDPSTATLLNLASCYEKQGRTATAWATYKEAASAADASGRKDYFSAAERHAKALEPDLGHLTINVEQPVDGLRVLRDGVVVDHAEWGVAIPVDPGSHALEATAVGHKGWTSSVSVADKGAQAVSVPALEALPVEATPAVPLVVAPVESAPAGDTTTHRGVPTQTIAGWVVGGAGIVGLAIGTAIVVVAENKYSSSKSLCEASHPDICSPQGVSERNDARDAGNAATLALGLGAAAVVAGGVLWLTAPSSASAKHTGSLRIVPALGGASLEGTW